MQSQIKSRDETIAPNCPAITDKNKTSMDIIVKALRKLIFLSMICISVIFSPL
jgi:hypothetical protein